MLFNSLIFILLFLPVMVLGYYFLNARGWFRLSNWFLIAGSLFFYAYWDVRCLPVILTSVLFNFVLGSYLAGDSETRPRVRYGLLIAGIITNLLGLAYYKYMDFFIENINLVMDVNISYLNIVLPLAISFFTFQQIAYLVDSYRGETKNYNLSTYMLFVTFFPQLIAGPIVSHKGMVPQFESIEERTVNYKNIYVGILVFLMGLFKKVVVADTFASYATQGFDVIDSLNVLGGWFTSLAYTLQIYFDFSGYCDMALGGALLFNIRLPINFNSPYKALNIQDFWRRWHITLSRFLRDHIYIPLGGNRKGQKRAGINIFMVFLLGGLWHGAAWTFVVWGVLHGLANVVFRVWRHFGCSMGRFLGWFITFNFINIAWVFFRANSFQSACKVLGAMFDFKRMQGISIRQTMLAFGADWWILVAVVAGVLCCVLMPNSIELSEKMQVKSKKQSVVMSVLMAVLLVVLLMKMVVLPYSEFIYFNF